MAARPPLGHLLAGLNVVTWVEGQAMELCEVNIVAVAPEHYFLRMGTGSDTGCVHGCSGFSNRGLTVAFAGQTGCR